MPFGLFKKKESEPPTGPPMITTPAAGALSINDAQDLLHTIESAKVQGLGGQLAHVKESASHSLKLIDALANDMEHEKLKLEGVEHRYKSVAENAKRTVVSALKREAATELPQIQSANDAKKFKEKFEAMMKRFGEVSGSHSKMLNAFMKKHASRMKVEFEALTKLLNETRSAITEFEQGRAPIVKCSNILNTASQKASSIRNSEASVQDTANYMKRIEGEIESLKNELGALRASSEFNEAQAVTQKAAEADVQVEQFHAQLTDLFSHVSRAFTKYSYGLTKETEARLQKMSEEPWTMLDEDDISPYFSLLQEIRKSVDAGKIQLKDSDRVVHHLDVILNSLPELRSKSQTLKSQVHLLKRGDTSAVDRASEIEAEITQHEEELAKCVNDTEQQRRQILEKSSELDILLKDASAILEELTGQRYVLQY